MSKPNRSQRLFIELGTTLHLEPNDPDRSVSGELVGMQVGQYLIVRIPDKSWETSGPTDGGHLNVKYILSDDVFGFTTHIIRSIHNPDDLFFLEYPETVESCNIRAIKRVECFLPARISLAEADRTALSGVIVNINKQGCLALIDGHPELACCITTAVTLELPYGEFDTLCVKGEVRTVRKEGGQSRFGILFTDLDNYAKKVLTTLVPALKL